MKVVHLQFDRGIQESFCRDGVYMQCRVYVLDPRNNFQLNCKIPCHFKVIPLKQWLHGQVAMQPLRQACIATLNSSVAPQPNRTYTACLGLSLFKCGKRKKREKRISAQPCIQVFLRDAALKWQAILQFIFLMVNELSKTVSQTTRPTKLHPNYSHLSCAYDSKKIKHSERLILGLVCLTGIYFMGECHECIDYQQCIMGTSVGSALWIYLANLTNFTNLAFLAYI